MTELWCLRESPECHRWSDFPLCFWKSLGMLYQLGTFNSWWSFCLYAMRPEGAGGHMSECSLWNSFTLRVSLLHFSPHPPPPFFFPFCFFFYGRKFLLALAETALIDLICTEVIFLLSSQSIKRSCPESSEKELPAAGLVSDAKWLALVQPSLVSSGVVRHSTNSSHISICHRSYLILPYSDTMQKVKW